MSLKRRVDRLSARLIPPPRPERQLSPESIAVMQRIVNDTYSDPVRNAEQIELFEQCRLKCEGQEP